MRAAILIVLGLFIGSLGTVFALNALRARTDPMPQAVMAIMSHHVGALHAAVKAGQCAPAVTQANFATLLAVSTDIGPAFQGAEQDFIDEAGRLHRALQKAASAPAVDCPSLAAAIKPVDAVCEQCHAKYR